MDRPQIAAELGVSVDRVRRHAARLGVASIQAGVSSTRPISLIDAAGRARLHDAIGPAPAMACARLHLSETDVRVAIATANAPRGLVSARAVARRADVSPTSAARSIERLRERGILTSTNALVALGTARHVQLLQLDRTSRASRPIARAMTTTPARTATVDGRTRAASRKVPNELRHVFWNVADSQLSLPESGSFIARRLASTDDLDGLSWGVQNLDADAWRHAAETRGLSPRRRRLIENLAVDAERGAP